MDKPVRLINAEEAFHNALHNNFKVEPLEKVVVVLNDHCNLNCARCSHFSPLVTTEKYIEKEKYTRDMIRLKEITNEHPVKHICIMGGEPLLNPDINYYLDFTAKMFSSTNIYLTTNGILLEKMDSEFWNIIRDTKNIFINVSKYFESSFYDKIEMLFKSNNIDRSKLIFCGSKEFGTSLFINFQLKKDGYGLTSEELFGGCQVKNLFNRLIDGKVYACQIQADIHILEDYFHEGFDRCTEYGIDIYDHSYDEIISYLKKDACKGCKYCCPNAYNALYFPEHSKKERSEWIKD